MAILTCNKKPVLDVAFGATNELISQDIIFSAGVRRHLLKSRQISISAPEAGGQLFGIIDVDRVFVEKATGPYKSDSRSRYHYRSDPGVAQRNIDKEAKKGRLYLGDWHTHPERVPKASCEDVTTFKKMIQSSSLISTAHIMLIQGTGSDMAGMAVYTFDGSEWNNWEIKEIKGVIAL